MKATSLNMQIASDVDRDGVGAELLEGDTVVAEVFRSDRDHRVIVTTFGNDVPLVSLERLVAYARDRLGPFEDGTPLPTFEMNETTRPTRG